MILKILLILWGLLVYIITVIQICDTIERCYMIKYCDKVATIELIERED